MRVLITGATGFIGRHLTKKMSEKGYFVRCLVRETSNIECLKQIDVEILYGDLLNKNSLSKALEKIDLVYHLAGTVYSRKKSDFYKGNVLATKNLLEASVNANIKRLIYVSSIAVHKPSYNRKLINEDSPYGPITIYGKTKLLAENLVQECPIPTIMVRAPIIYGPYQPEVLNKFFEDAIYKKRLVVIGDGENLRSLCYIDNFIDGLILLADITSNSKKIYVFSDKTAYTINEIIGMISRVIGHKIKIVNLPYFISSISWLVHNIMEKAFGLYFIELYAIKTISLNLGCDIKKAREEVGYAPSIDLISGIKRTINWIKKRNLL